MVHTVHTDVFYICKSSLSYYFIAVKIVIIRAYRKKLKIFKKLLDK